MKRRDLKVLWSSNVVWSNSGYARFTDDWSQRVKKDGWDLRLIGFAGLSGGIIEHKGIYTYPQCESMWGDDALFHHGNHFGANVRFTMQDVHSLNPQWLQQMPNWVPYTPIDREDVQPAVLNALKYAYKIITFSKFGQKALQKHGFASTMIPEGVDVSIFKPLDKTETRKKLNFPLDKFVVGMIGANKPDGIPRKGWQQALDAFKLFVDKHPESMFFYESNQTGGFDIEGYAAYLGIRDKLMTPNLYMSIFHGSPEVVNEWLNCFDVLLHPSTTEGFGLVVTEAQAAGTPVIINNVMSMPELIIEGKTGFACTSSTKIWTAGGGYIYIPDVTSIYDKLEEVYLLVQDENKVTVDCRNWIKKNYNIDTIVQEQWFPYLEDLQNEMLPLQVDTLQKKV